MTGVCRPGRGTQQRQPLSLRQLGYLERINSDGRRCTGSFSGGVFHPCDPGTP